jgi:hypothetical protein
VNFSDQGLVLEVGEIFQTINSDLSTIFDWGDRNLIQFNSSKTQVSYISRLRTENSNHVKINDVPIKAVDNVRILGVDLCSNLKWNAHVLGIAKGAAKKLGFLNRCRKYFNSRQVLQIYKSFIRPCLEYCSNVWGGAAQTTLSYLDSIQRRAIRMINNPSLTNDLDTLEHRRKVADLSIFYRYYHHDCSSEINALMPPSSNVPIRTTRQSSRAHKYSVKLTTSRTEDYHRNFFNRTARLWNELPAHVFPEKPEKYSRGSAQVFKEKAHKHLRAGTL